MRLPRFFQAGSIQTGEALLLSTENVRHAIQVMRLRPNDLLIIFNGEGGEYTARICTATKRSAEVEILSYDPVNRESPLNIQLACALIKPDKMDITIQKAVELGVTHIQPLLTERSVIQIKATRLEKKLRHWKAIIKNACEQCGRTRIPDISSPVRLQHYLLNPPSGLRLAMSPTAKKTVQHIKKCRQPSSIEILIGPEGGFSETETDLIEKDKHTLLLSFGPRILRAETAAIASLVLLQSTLGDIR